MALEEYKRKRRFQETPEPPPKIEKQSRHRFVVQKHDATRLHYDFRLEMEGVLKSWAVPKGPSLDPAEKRLAMQVEDHPVSYFDFEGIIPEGNYGAGTVIVWDIGTWEPLSPEPVNGQYLPGTDAEASAMLQKGDLKIRLNGKKLKGDFALVHIRSRRSGSKGNEWLLIKKHDKYEVPGYDIGEYGKSALSGRTIEQIAGNKDAAEWESGRKASHGKLKAPWLADTLAELEKNGKKAKAVRKSPQSAPSKKKTEEVSEPRLDRAKSGKLQAAKSAKKSLKNEKSDAWLRAELLQGAIKRAIPSIVNPMLAVAVEAPFDDPEWLFEIKWDGYRAVTFIENDKVRLVSRNQNDLTGAYPELHNLPRHIKAHAAIVDGEVVALDDQGHSSFSLMQQRTGIREGGRRKAGRDDIPVVYYAFDLLYLDGYDLHRVSLEERKRLLSDILVSHENIRYSDHFDQGIRLFELAKEKGLEGILAKRRTSCYEERRSREWLKIKVTQTVDCVIGGYTDPEGSREYFGSLVLGLYDDKGKLIHIGQVGTGFDYASLKQMWQRLQKLETSRNPFSGHVEARRPHWIEPELVAEIKFTEWTHETTETSPKLRAPVFLRLREDKKPEDCQFNQKPLRRV